ncbi:MAG TPA: hypothetical protein PL011_04110 [Kiritimatiellia bacterium]|nr:hypothetical protein [Kiritimatiellia bacterium]
MTGKPTKYFFLLSLAGILFIFIGVVALNHAVRFNPNRWLRDNRDTAEHYAQARVNGDDVAIPTQLSDYKIETGNEWVSYGRLNGPFNSYGMIYSPNGYKPENGLGGEPIIRKWEHIQGNWYYWVAD